MTQSNIANKIRKIPLSTATKSKRTYTKKQAESKKVKGAEGVLIDLTEDVSFLIDEQVLKNGEGSKMDHTTT